MALAPGTKLGPYEILSLIGAGGMGEVYRARGTKLKRDVATRSSDLLWHRRQGALLSLGNATDGCRDSALAALTVVSHWQATLRH